MLLRRLVLLLLVALTRTIPLGMWSPESCADEKHRDVCNSKACPGYSWCEICEKCMPKHQAVTKDEL